MFWFFRQKRYEFIKQSFGGAQPNISQNVVKATLVPIPPIDKQSEIISYLNNIDSQNSSSIECSVVQDILDEIKKTLCLKNTINQFDELFIHQEDLLKKLRQAILQEAVQGKLVEQDPNDEPASELLKKIKAEKQKLTTEGKLKKEKPLPEIKPEEIPFEIPSNWVWCRLEDLALVGTGATPLTSIKEYYSGNIPWITSSATNNLFVNSAEEFITEKAVKETNCKIYPKGTLIVAMYGQGKTRGQVTELLIDACTNQACAAINLFHYDFEHKKYIKLFFQKIYSEIRKLAEGGAQPNLNLQKIKDTIIPLPPLNEQKRIVEKVNKLMTVCDQLEEQIQKSKLRAELLMKVVLKEVFEGSESSGQDTEDNVVDITERLKQKAIESCVQNGFVDIKGICNSEGLVIVKDKSLEAKAELRFEDDKFCVYVSDKSDNFSIAHEAAHYALHPEKVKQAEEQKVARKGEFSLSKAEEKVVDDFAAELLMPEECLRDYLESSLNALETQEIEPNIIRKLSKQFRVSDIAMKRRLENLGYKVVQSQWAGIK